SEGNTLQSQITASMDVLNKDFAGSELTFKLEKVEHITNADWFNWAQQDSTNQTEMKQSLRKGNASALNVYTGCFSDIVGTGYATFPADYSSAPMDDGVLIRYTTLPGGTNASWDLGRILTHEVGQWVGLYHTSSGGCSEPGDFVADNPPQGNQSPSSGCLIGKDTCPGGGPDPVHNHIDYSDDSCKTEFTPGQIARLQAQLTTYRGVYCGLQNGLRTALSS
ncbi:hypothetical protein B0J17DRAFT_563330, partial [Rhizoctonia solani]